MKLVTVEMKKRKCNTRINDENNIRIDSIDDKTYWECYCNERCNTSTMYHRQ